MAEASDSRLVTRVQLRNYKSIAACDVHPGSLSFLVGPNGAGKSNFLDALCFVADSLRSSLDHALRERGGIDEVRRRSGGHPNYFGIRLDLELPETRGHYSFLVGARKARGWAVQREQCYVLRRDQPAAFYEVKDGEVQRSSLSPAPAAAKDRLYLVRVSGVDEFRPVYDALSRMGFYNLSPEQIKDLQPPDPGELLASDGANLASVLSNLEHRAPETKKQIEEYLARVVPGIVSVRRKTIGPKETLEFRQEVSGARDPWRFPASSMSDGTLRALGVLVAVFQGATNGHIRHLIGIEEPEVALHPAAAAVLMDALTEAAESSQIFVTSHSSDLLDDPSIPDDSILAVVAEHGETKIARLDAAGRKALREQLYTAGELLRMKQLQPDPSQIPADPSQLQLFEDE